MLSPVPYTDFGVVIKCVCVGCFYVVDTLRSSDTRNYGKWSWKIDLCAWKSHGKVMDFFVMEGAGTLIYRAVIESFYNG